MAENADDIIHFGEYFKVIRNRLWVILTIFFLTILTGWYVVSEVLPKYYTAVAQIIIQPRGTVLVSTIDSAQTDKPFDPVSFQTEYAIMDSSDVLLPIINDLDLKRIWAARISKGSVEKWSDQEALAYMNKVLKLDYTKGTDIVVITVSSEVPKEAASIANALAEKYKAMRDDEQKVRSDTGAETLTAQIADQQKVVDDKMADVEKLQKQAAEAGFPIVAGTDGTIGQVDRDLESRKRDLLSAQQDYDARRVLLESVQNLPDDKFIDTLIGMKQELPEIEALRSDAFKLDSDTQNLLKEGYAEDHPRVQSLQAELESKKKQITALTAGLRSAMAVETDTFKSRVELLQQQVDKLTQESHDEQSALVPYREALQDYRQQHSLLDALTVRRAGAQAEKPLFESPVRIFSRADIPETPSSPKVGLDMGISVGAGLVVGFAVAFLIEYLDTSVKTMADAELLLGLPVLTVIPNKGGPMPLVQDSSRLPHAEGYRILRAKLDLKVQNGIGPSLSMLSGGPGEGKSTTIYNLAVVCAQAGQSVILVDCDLRRPTLHELLNVSNERGLSNYLRGEGDATEFVQQTSLPKLHILTAGNMPMSEIGVLVGDKIRLLLDDLKQRYDMVLIDSPPVLGISDGSIIAREVDYVILVIQHRRYPREISLRAKRAIEEVHGNCVGMVLNCVSVKSDDAYYYYSSYGNYYSKTDRAKKRKGTASAKVKANGKPVLASTRKADLESDEF